MYLCISVFTAVQELLKLIIVQPFRNYYYFHLIGCKNKTRWITNNFHYNSKTPAFTLAEQNFNNFNSPTVFFMNHDFHWTYYKHFSVFCNFMKLVLIYIKQFYSALNPKFYSWLPFMYLRKYVFEKYCHKYIIMGCNLKWKVV